MFRVCCALVGLVAVQTSAFVVPATQVVRAPKQSTTSLAAVRTPIRVDQIYATPLLRASHKFSPIFYSTYKYDRPRRRLRR